MEGEIYPNYRLEREIINFIEVWLCVVVSICYCYISAKFVRKGIPRLFSIIPIVYLFLTLPLKLHSVNLGGNTAFFIAWLSNFKLLLLAFDKGPLSNPSLSLPHFIAVACFPIKIQQNPPPISPSNLDKSLKTQKKVHPSQLDDINSQNAPQNDTNKENPCPKVAQKGHISIRSNAAKCVLVALFLHIYQYSDRMHQKVILVIYCLHIYLELEIMLVAVAAMARSVLGVELEPPFNEPYLSTSLQDFWGKRWNLIVSRTLRPTVYQPVLSISARLIGRKWAALPAVMSTFVVSGLMHELMFYYFGRVRPTWEVTWFFLLHGVCVMVEIGMKKVVKDRWTLPRVIATPVTVGFVMVTAFWLFFPQFLRSKVDVRGLGEFALFEAFLKDVAAGAVKFGNFGAKGSVQ